MSNFSRYSLSVLSFARSLPLALLGLAAVGLTGCTTVQVYSNAPGTKQCDDPRESTAITGRVLTPADLRASMPRVQLSDTAYAEVKSEWLRQFYHDFRHELFKQGVVNWSPTFNCKHFAGYYAELAQSRFYVETFRSRTTLPAKTLALGPVWYTRHDGQGRHAIIVALTERGRIFIEPQTGEEMKLTSNEQASITLALL